MSRFTKINFPVFEKAKKVLGHLKISINFVVPMNSNWPSEFKGIKLGRLVDTTRQNMKKNKYEEDDVKKLLEMGFIPDMHKLQSERALLGFEEFKKIKGNNFPKLKNGPKKCMG